MPPRSRSTTPRSISRSSSDSRRRSASRRPRWSSSRAISTVPRRRSIARPTSGSHPKRRSGRARPPRHLPPLPMTSRTSRRVGWWEWKERSSNRQPASRFRRDRLPASSDHPPAVLFPILASRTGWHTDQLRRAVAERGHESVVLRYEALVARLGNRSTHAAALHAEAVDVAGAGAVIARIIPAGSLEQIIYRVDALHWLEDRGGVVLNSPRAIERTVDKFYASALLQQASLPTPDTVVCERADDAMAAFTTFGDAIVKPLFGSMGLGMTRVSDPDTAWRVFRAIESIRGVYYLQRALPHDGRDVRAFVVGDRVIGAIERSAPG